MTIEEMEALCQKHNQMALFHQIRLPIVTSNDWQDWKPEWVDRVLGSGKELDSFVQLQKEVERVRMRIVVESKHIQRLKEFQQDIMKQMRKKP